VIDLDLIAVLPWLHLPEHPFSRINPKPCALNCVMIWLIHTVNFDDIALLAVCNYQAFLKNLFRSYLARVCVFRSQIRVIIAPKPERAFCWRPIVTALARGVKA
jgi:hypothetical protein